MITMRYSFHNIFLGGEAEFIFLIAFKDNVVLICIISNYITFLLQRFLNKWLRCSDMLLKTKCLLPDL